MRMMAVGCLLGWLVAGAGNVTAQKAVLSKEVWVAAQQVNERTEANTTFHRLVTVKITRAPIQDAIQVLAKEAKVQVQYREAIFSEITSPVTYHATNVSVGTAFADILKGTNLAAESPIAGFVTIQQALATSTSETGIITGRVIHAETKRPVAGATITVADGRTRAVTDQDGTFRLVVNEGSHTLHVRYIGMIRQSKVVTASADGTVNVEFALEPSASVLDEVVVTGTVVATERRAIPTPITVITADEIERRGITRIEQFFRGEIPGVVVLEEGTAALQDGNLGGGVTSKMFARGASGMVAGGVGYGAANPLKTYIDGVELLDPSYLGTIDPKTIERIEVITGPQAATIYGSGAMGGVMQIFTKQGSGRTAPDITLTARYGLLESSLSNGYAPLHDHVISLAGGSGPQFSYSANLSYGYTGPWQPQMFGRRYGASVGATHTQGSLVLSGSVATTATSNGTIGGGVFGSNPVERVLFFSGALRIGNPAGYNRRRISTSNSQLMSLNADYRSSSFVQHHLTVGRSQANFDLVPLAPAFVSVSDSLYRASLSTGQRTTVSYTATILPPRLGVFSSTFTAGLNGSVGEQTRLDGCRVMPSASAYVPCSPTGALSASRTLNVESWGGFTTWQLGLFDHLYLTLGLRGERNAAYGSAHKIDWTPTNGVAYTLEVGDLTIKALGSYGRATRAPAPEQRVEQFSLSTGYEPERYLSQFANPHLTPEYSRGPQGGLEFYYGSRGSFTINRYTQTVSDLILSVPVDSISLLYLPTGTVSKRAQNQYLNVGKVRQHGWELTGTLNVSVLSLKGTYSWTDSRVAAIDSRNSSVAYFFPVGGSFKGLMTHTGNVIATFSHGGTSLSFITNYVGKGLEQVVYAGMRGHMYWSLYLARLQMYSDRSSTAGGGNLMLDTPAYTKSDLLMTHRLRPWITATVNIENVGDNYRSDVEDYGVKPSLGRQTKFGLSLRFPRNR